jgi:hypothetical protein
MSNWNTINPFPNGVAKVIAGSNVSVSGTTAYPIITNTGVASLTAGSNITLSGSTGNITIAASGGSGGSPVYIENFTGSSSNFSPSVNTTYFYYTEPVAFPTYPNVPVYTSFYLPNASSLSNGNWIQIVPLHSIILLLPMTAEQASIFTGTQATTSFFQQVQLKQHRV